MPAILSPQDYDEWLDRGEEERAPFTCSALSRSHAQIHAAKSGVANLHNQDAALLDPQ